MTWEHVYLWARLQHGAEQVDGRGGQRPAPAELVLRQKVSASAMEEEVESLRWELMMQFVRVGSQGSGSRVGSQVWGRRGGSKSVASAMQEEVEGLQWGLMMQLRLMLGEGRQKIGPQG